MTISPNGTRVLRSFGFDFKKVGGVAIRHIRGYNAITFEPRFDHDFGDAEEMCGAPRKLNEDFFPLKPILDRFVGIFFWQLLC